MKKFWKYFTIVVLLLIGLCAIGILYLFFIPGASLFGIQYISLNKDYYSESRAITGVDKIELNSLDYDVRIVPAVGDKASVKVYANSLGFLLTKNAAVKIDIVTEASTLKFNVTEPSGAVIRNRSYIELRIPTDSSLSLAVNNKNALVNVSNETLTINKLSYKANWGTFILDKCTINGDMNLNLNRSIFTISSTAVTNSNNISLDIGSGRFDASDKVLNNITINSNVKGVVLAKECATLTEEVESAGGRIDIKKVANIRLKSSDTNVYIDELTIGGTIDMTASGNINIGNTHGITHIHTANGQINIKKAEKPLYLTSTNGDITVESAKYFIQTESTYGNINITFDETAGKYVDTGNDITEPEQETKFRYLKATTENGKITCTGVEHIILNISKNGRADIYMNDVLGSNVVHGSNGSIYIQFSDMAKFDLTTASVKGSVNVNFLGLGGDAYTSNIARTFQINSSDGTNSLVANTASGNLRVRDDQTANQGY